MSTLQWLPYDWHCQAIYLVYRWIIAFYFLGWIIANWVVTTEGRRYFVILTNWAFITYNLYLIIAALSTTVSYLSTHFICKQAEDEFSREDDFVIKKLSGCCGYQDNKLSWYQMIHWLFFTIGNELAFVILLLYWILLYRGGPVDGINANTHIVNGFVAVVDFVVSGVPVNLLHFIYLMIYGSIYVIFTGIYFVFTNDIIYPVIDYENRRVTATVVDVCLAIIVFPLVHILFYFMYLDKLWIMYRSFRPSYELLQTDYEDEENASGDQ